MMDELMQGELTDDPNLGSAIGRFAIRNLTNVVSFAEETQRVQTDLRARDDLDPAARHREQTERSAEAGTQLMGEVVSSFREELLGSLGLPWMKPKQRSAAGKGARDDEVDAKPSFEYSALPSGEANSNPHHQSFKHLFNANTRLEIYRDVKIDLLSKWLTIRDMGRLDAALTSRVLRPAFLALLRGMRAVAFDTYHYGSLPLLRWVGHKGLDVRKLDATFCEVRDGDTALIWACKENEVDLVVLLYQGSDINTPTHGTASKTNLLGASPIHFACNSRNLAIAKLLLSVAKLNVESKDALGRNALHLAIEPATALPASTEENACEIVKLLLARSAALVTAVDNAGTTPLMAACRVGQLDLVQLLLEGNANPCDMTDKKGKTCMFLACSNGHTPVVRALVDRFGEALAVLENRGVSSSSSSGDGKTCLHIACSTGHSDLVGILLNELNVHFLPDSKGRNPLHVACEQGFIDIARLLLTKHPEEIDSVDKDRNSALHLACQSGHVHVAIMLIKEFGISLNARNRIGYTSLHNAVSKGKFECAKMLVVEAGAFVNAQGVQGSTPLIIACFKNMVAIAKMLVLEGKAETDVTSNMGTALYLSVENNKLELVQLLLREGCSIPDVVCQPDGSTALHLAAAKVNVDAVKCLLMEGRADPNIKLHSNGQTALHKVCDAVDTSNQCYSKTTPITEIIAALCEAKCLVDEMDQKGKTALHLAVDNKNLEAVRVLCQHGANPSFNAFDGSSPLSVAVSMKNEEMVMMLVTEFGAEVNTPDECGLRPLLIAARLGQRAIVKTLIKAGADVNAVDGEGMTALTLAACCAGQDVIKLLLESGADKSVRDIHGKVPLDYTELKSIRKLLL